MAKRGNGAGTITRRRDGRWEAKISLPDGSRRSFYAKTERDVRRKLRDADRLLEMGVAPQREVTLEAFAKEWLDAVRSTVRYKTFQQYESMVRVHIVPAIGSVRLAQLTPFHLERLYIDEITNGSSPTTVGHMHKVLRLILARGVEWGALIRNVATIVKPPRKPKHELDLPSMDQVHRLLDAAGGDPLEALWILALTTGARCGEILGLTWENVDLSAGQVRIIQALQELPNGALGLVETKTRRSRRTLILPPMTIDALQRHRERQECQESITGRAWTNTLGLVFTTSAGTPIDRHNLLRRNFHPLLQAAGIQPTLRLHDLRHMAASLLLSNGVPVVQVSEMLGHANISTTLNIYGHFIPSQNRAVADTMQNLLKSSPPID